VLALRDELTSRAFDDPGEWWPDQPGVIGGRDRTAGGSWCVSDIASGTTAMVLNRPEKKVADEGAPSRGVLPLLAVQHREKWPEALELKGMASFAVVLADPDTAALWVFDGERLSHEELGDGTHMVTSGGAEDGKADRHLATFSSLEPEEWRTVLEPPVDDLAALVVRHEREGLVYATVFGQLIDAAPGELKVSYAREPWQLPWTERTWAGRA
jgi:hypothetical protein